MLRYISWLVIGVASAFLVVATTAFSISTTASLAFAISVGTLVVAATVSYRYRKDVATLSTGVATALVSAWTIVASVVFSQSTVQDLALAGGLAVAGLAIAGMTEHELASERAVGYSTSRDEHEPRLSTAA
jgi:peptidoglycan/LPS O-acetylase OafA/YrhL